MNVRDTVESSPSTPDPTPAAATPAPDLQTYLRSLRACDEAVEWAADYDDLPSAWAACERGDWMLWLLATGRLADDRTLRRLACRMVRETPLYGADGQPDGRTVWDLLTDERSRVAVETAERWCDGRATDEELRAAWAAAWTAAWAAQAAIIRAAIPTLTIPTTETP
jgi:hypothetical protein